MPIAHSGGVSIRYQSVGAGPVVILHHGGGFRLESWKLAGWVDSLAPDCQVVSFDARGNGESDKPTDPDDYALDLMVSDVLAVADACEAERVNYLGWSLGGKVGWGLVDQAQNRLASLALIGAEPEASGETASAMIALVEQGIFVSLDDEDHVTSFLSARARTAYRDFLRDLRPTNRNQDVADSI